MPKPTETGAEQSATALLTVTVIKEGHEHDGKPIQVGETIEVDAATADWLREHNIIEG